MSSGEWGRAGSATAEDNQARRTVAAWHRVEDWLRTYAPASYATLAPGATPGELAALEDALGVRLPAQLKALWQLCGGVTDGEGARFMFGDRALMALPRVSEIYQEKREEQREREAEDDYVPEEDVHWRPEWVPFCSFDVRDETSGLYLDGGTGEIRKWERTNEVHDSKADSFADYLEAMADGLEHPAPPPAGAGLLRGRALHWGVPVLAAEAAVWAPLRG